VVEHLPSKAKFLSLNPVLPKKKKRKKKKRKKKGKEGGGGGKKIAIKTKLIVNRVLAVLSGPQFTAGHGVCWSGLPGNGLSSSVCPEGAEQTHAGLACLSHCSPKMEPQANSEQNKVQHWVWGLEVSGQ
jgi:hypothetical protein